MTEFLRKFKRALVAWRERAKVRSEAARAFRYDERQFMENAGALHLDRKAAARAEIGLGYLVLLGVTHADTEKSADEIAGHIVKLRIFEDGDLQKGNGGAPVNFG